MNIDHEIDSIITSISENYIGHFYGQELDGLSIDKLRRTYKVLDRVKRIFKKQSLDIGDILSLQSRIVNLINHRSMYLDKVEGDLEKVIWELNSLRTSKAMKVIGKGIETTVEIFPSYFLADKVLKRIFETTDKNFVEAYKARIELYIRRMNNISPNFKLWPAEIKFITKKDKDMEVYVVYFIQKRFAPEFTLKSILKSCDEATFFKILTSVIDIVLKLIKSNSSNDVIVSGDFQEGNLLGIDGMVYYFDYHNPYLRIGNEKNEKMGEIWDAMKRGKNDFFVKIPYFVFVNKMFVPERLMRKIFFGFMTTSKRSYSDVYPKMLEILIEKIREHDIAFDINKFQISKTSAFLMRKGMIVFQNIII